MASPPMLGLVEVPRSLEATLVCSPHTTPICDKGTVSSRSGGHSMGNVLPSIPAMGENTVNVGGTLNTEALVDNPNPKEVDNMQLLVLEEQSNHRERQYPVEENIHILVPQLSDEITIPIQIPPIVTTVLGEESGYHFVNDRDFTNSISAHLGSASSAQAELSRFSIVLDAATDSISQGQNITHSESIVSAEQTVVWVANRDFLVKGTSAVLTINNEGSLVIMDEFDYPSDTFLPGMKLGYNLRTGKVWSLTSWKSAEDHSLGTAQLKMDPKQPNEYFLYQWLSNGLEEWDSTVRRLLLDMFGQVKQLNWLETSQEWFTFWIRLRYGCEAYAYCGSFSSRDASDQNFFCHCLQGFRPLDSFKQLNPSSGSQKNQNFRIQRNANWHASMTVLALHNEGAGCSLCHGELFNPRQILKDDPDGQTIYLKLAASEFQIAGGKKLIWAIALALPLAVLLLASYIIYRWRRKIKEKVLSHQKRRDGKKPGHVTIRYKYEHRDKYE
ncbi:hypothetical protein EZV62_008492 [Acer yangbiense]|uniref:S-locus glycoprotein domain-containing protein n=1 Tax=Acer yangbiense TaxID=1000413 RepID=A0A5C7ID87_9ROSI|nr:hypothetical protein EZV62_008492 [Acer yangbiense]